MVEDVAVEAFWSSVRAEFGHGMIDDDKVVDDEAEVDIDVVVHSLRWYAAAGFGVYSLTLYVVGSLVPTVPVVRLLSRCLHCCSMSDDPCWLSLHSRQHWNFY